MAGESAIARQLIQLLLMPGVPPAVRAYISGTMWELAAATEAAQQLVEAAAVHALLSAVAQIAAVAGTGKGKNKKTVKSAGAASKQGKGSDSSKQGKAGKGSSKGQPPAGPVSSSSALLQDPQVAAEVAMCNATGEHLPVHVALQLKEQAIAAVHSMTPSRCCCSGLKRLNR
eukprot:GHRR01023801.1.p1 GENE.GHRR01023801.1~~GHRR01023801.1.p1  ORF type:complete len:192 (+),score=105.43 GHRR01023801.1:63-578(+)